METHITLWWLAAGVAVTVGASVGDRVRRHRPLAWHAYWPWRTTIFLGAGVVMFAAAHLLTLAKQAGG